MAFVLSRMINEAHRDPRRATATSTYPSKPVAPFYINLFLSAQHSLVHPGGHSFFAAQHVPPDPQHFLLRGQVQAARENPTASNAKIFMILFICIPFSLWFSNPNTILGLTCNVCKKSHKKFILSSRSCHIIYRKTLGSLQRLGVTKIGPV